MFLLSFLSSATFHVDEEKPMEERGYYLHGRAYRLPMSKEIEQVRDADRLIRETPVPAGKP